MTDSLVLTFAEVELLLRIRQPELTSLRDVLGLPETNDVTAAAGLASLMARGLCTHTAGKVVPSKEVVAIVAGLSTADRATRVLGWVGEQMIRATLLTGPEIHIGLFAAELGQFDVAPLDRTVPLADQIGRFLDSCLGSAAGTALVQTVTAAGKVSIAVATDSSGTWFQSDSERDPDTASPSTRDDVVARVAELVAGEAAGAR
ncbi:hypothetical protein FKR81_00380 [Lentzea tibetensis]|uniref:Uncharacterized protein n=1 Tax=Lentzea tibetensis TaxID=2591470 RepID=A0A563F2C5_9PSEU|nr:hypothetical protein [Lentzea tibetensis]TWP54063.1 hypothetical protein FKR81_00380 [Lentzea tibetensis]